MFYCKRNSCFCYNIFLFDTIMTIYGARYQKALKQKLIDLLRTYDSFKNIQSDDFKIPNNFPK